MFFAYQFTFYRILYTRFFEHAADQDLFCNNFVIKVCKLALVYGRRPDIVDNYMYNVDKYMIFVKNMLWNVDNYR